jgi:Putative Flp pilus-assembly TadE/G-like
MIVTKNQKGNISLLVLGLMGVTMIMFLVVLSFSKVFAIKEKASTAAEQASYAATSVIYEVTMDSVKEYDESLPGKVEDVIDQTLQERIEEKKQDLLAYNPFLSENEGKIQAINKVVSEELTTDGGFGLGLGLGVRKELLNSILLNNLRSESTNQKIRSAVSDVILSNGGILEGTTVEYLDQFQIKVETSARYEALKYDELIPEDKRKLKQKAKGPEIDFMKELNVWSDYSIQF